MPSSIAAFEGTCVSIPCRFDFPDELRPAVVHGVWYFNSPYPKNYPPVVFKSRTQVVHESFQGRSRLLGDLGLRNCTLLLSSLSPELGGKYYFRGDLGGYNQYTFSEHSVLDIVSEYAGGWAGAGGERAGARGERAGPGKARAGLEQAGEGQEQARAGLGRGLDRPRWGRSGQGRGFDRQGVGLGQAKVGLGRGRPGWSWGGAGQAGASQADRGRIGTGRVAPGQAWVQQEGPHPQHLSREAWVADPGTRRFGWGCRPQCP